MPNAPARTSGLAITGLVCGVLGFVSLGLLGLIGLVLSIMAQGSINRSGGRIGGRGVATAGIIVSASSLLMGCVIAGLIGLLLPALAKARESARSLKDQAQLSQVGMAVLIYTADNDGRFPSADSWPQDLVDLQFVTDESIFESSFAIGQGRSFAMNANLGGVRDAEVTDPELTVLMFECAPGSPPAGGPELLAAEPRAYAGYAVCFADGSVMRVQREEIPTLIWRLDE
jgi:hypothetical protein